MIPRRHVLVAGLDQGEPQTSALGLLDAYGREELPDEFRAVGLVVGQRLAGPLPRVRRPLAGDAEQVPAMSLALAAAGNGLVGGADRDDAVTQPYRAAFRARYVLELGVPEMTYRG
nr:hypothetical protein [Nocardia sienata]